MDKKSKKKFYCKNVNVKNKRQEDLSGMDFLLFPILLIKYFKRIFNNNLMQKEFKILQIQWSES